MASQISAINYARLTCPLDRPQLVRETFTSNKEYQIMARKRVKPETNSL